MSPSLLSSLLFSPLFLLLLFSPLLLLLSFPLFLPLSLSLRLSYHQHELMEHWPFKEHGNDTKYPLLFFSYFIYSSSLPLFPSPPLLRIDRFSIACKPSLTSREEVILPIFYAVSTHKRYRPTVLKCTIFIYFILKGKTP